MLSRVPPGVIFSVSLLLTAGLAILFPGLFLHWGSFQPRILVVPLLQFIMFAMGTRVSVADLRQVLAAPRLVVIGLGLQ